MESTKLIKLKNQYNETKKERDSVATLLGYHTDGILHKALALYDCALAKKIFELEYDIKAEEKRIKHIPKRLKELIGKKIKIIKVYDDREQEAVGQIGAVLDVNCESDCWSTEYSLITDIKLHGLGDSLYNFSCFIGSDKYRTVKEED